MVSLLKRSVLEAEDWLRYHPWVRGVVGRCKCLRDTMTAPSDHQARAWAIRRLCAAARLTSNDERLRRIEERLQSHLPELDARQVDWSEWVEDYHEPSISRGVILKPYIGPTEPGVFFVSFEMEWIKLLKIDNWDEFCRRYTLIVAPSSNLYNLVHFAFAAAYPAPFFSLISHADEIEIGSRITPKITMLPLYASHWVNPDLFPVRPRVGRPFDLIMVASFGKVKRHHLLFRALREMPSSLKVLLVGQDQEGRSAETIVQEARSYGVENQLTVVSNAAYEQVAAKFAEARASVLLSRREGSAVVVAESLFADTPVAMLEDAYIGSRAFINEQTGGFLTERDLARSLMHFLKRAERTSPRQWAMENISCQRSTQTLNNFLKEYSNKLGQHWTQDIATLTWRPDPQLASADDAERMQPEYEDFEKRFGITLR